MRKELKALERIKREAGTPYFSTLYDIDMWREDFQAIETALEALEIINELFDFDFAIRFGDNQPMIKITNKRNGQYWELPILKEKFDLLKETL